MEIKIEDLLLEIAKLRKEIEKLKIENEQLKRDVYKRQVPLGRIAQLGEHLPYKQGVTGSSPVVTTINVGEMCIRDRFWT